MGINVKSCFAYDVICCIEDLETDHYNQYEKYMFEKQKSALFKIKTLLTEQRFEDYNEYLSMSNVCYIINEYSQDKNVEELNLEDLINIFEKSEEVCKIVKGKIEPDSFMASLIYPDLDKLVNGEAKRYIEMLKALQKISFNEIWENEIYPSVNENVQRAINSIGKYEVDDILRDISRLKDCDNFNSFDIYISFFSCPIGFSLNKAFLIFINEFDGNRFLSVAIHELMHGFSKSDLTMKYKKIVDSDDFLSETHKTLIEKFQSGDEEEFVVGAEYFMSWKHGLYNKEELLQMALERYDTCMPLSVIIFDCLCKKMKSITEYNQWLMDMFYNNNFEDNTIKSKVDKIISEFSNCYFKKNTKIQK